MADEINVIVVDRGRKYLYLRYTDPVTGQKIEKSSGTAKKREAIKAAGEWQSELQSGLAKKNANLKWSVFRESYEEHVLATLADTTHAKVVGMFNVVAEAMKPDSVRRITAQWVSRFQKELLLIGREPSTVESHCRHLKAAMNWAKSQGLVSTVPTFNKLKKAKSAKVMKGRPITGEEFDRMILAVDNLPEKQRASLKFLLRGLWLSGLRIGEVMCLTWDQWADGIRVDASGKYVKLLIPSESEKGGQDRIYPVTPDFSEFLRSVPTDQRIGLVFNVVGKRGITRRADTASKLVVRLGEKASVKVDEIKGKTSYASAHDLRRAFGMRWARRVMPMVLKELMRHESVTTTEKYYVDIDADGTAALLAGLAPQGDTSVDTPQKAESLQHA